MRKIIDINNNWYFTLDYIEGMERDNSIEGYEKVNLPHTNLELPYNYFDEKSYQRKSIYKYLLDIDEDYQGKNIYVSFQGVMTYAKVYFNGEFVGDHKGGYTPFDIKLENIDFSIHKNIISVVVDSSELEDIPPFGGQIDYLTYGGIYREASLKILDGVFIERLKIETYNVLEENKGIKAHVFINNIKEIKDKIEFRLDVFEKNGDRLYSKIFIENINEKSDLYILEGENITGIELWDIDNPKLYSVVVTINVLEVTDTYVETIGFREAKFTPKGFYLNGKPVKIIGLNRHQSFPYVGYAMPKRVQEKDALILKKQLHLNLVRTSHYPQSVHFLNKCDEIGLLVFEEIPGWQHIGNKEWKEIAKANVKEMIQRDINHPSIILWGVRINESQDDDEFYKSTNDIARILDSTRQTGGVRYLTNSSFLEDVYTFNDFIHDGVEKPLRSQSEVTGLESEIPYLVTEFNGHMYPTKRFDQEERQMEHSLRHLRVQNSSFLDENISGAIGWCAFDYNTHKDFGSGDRICYHGVMDMFRIPKFASYVYKSQVAPEVEPVLEPITFWARGERSIGGILPLIIFTNCDYITFKYGDKEEKKIFPAYKEYKGVPYPPVIIDSNVINPEEAGSWGMRWEDAIIKGYYKDKEVVERKLCNNPTLAKLIIEGDDLVLSSKEKDATRIVVKAVDKYDNLLPFFDEIIKIEIEGPGRIQGPSEVILKGGAIAFWVETLNEKGTIKIKIGDGSQINIVVE